MQNSSSFQSDKGTIFDDLVKLQKIVRMEIDLRESYETLYQVQVNDKLIESIKENFRNQFRYWSDRDLFQYYVSEETIQLEIDK